MGGVGGGGGGILLCLKNHVKEAVTRKRHFIPVLSIKALERKMEANVLTLLVCVLVPTMLYAQKHKHMDIMHDHTLRHTLSFCRNC